MSPERKRVRWLRYLLGGLTITVLLLLVFYQPILFGLTDFVVQQVARSQKFTIRFKIHGSIFSNLLIQDLHLEPLPANQTLPIEKLEVRRLVARYNLFNLLQQKPDEIVRLIELKDVNLVVRPTPPTPPEPAKPSSAIHILPVLPQRIDINNVNVRVRRSDGDLVIQNFGINLVTGQPGTLTCGELALPPLGDWQRLRAGLLIKGGVIQLTTLALPPLLTIDQLSLDATRLAAGKLVIAVAGNTLNAPLRIDASLDSQTTQNRLTGAVQLEHLSLRPLQQMMNRRIEGSIPVIDISFDGDLNQPRSLAGHAVILGERFRYQDYQIDDLSLSVHLANGKGTIDRCLLNAGSNRVSLSGDFVLPPHMDAFVDEFTAHFGLAAALVEPARFIPNLQSSTFILGSGQVEAGQANAIFRFRNGQLKQGMVEVPQVEAIVGAVARLPLPNDLWSGCAALVEARVNGTKVETARIERVSVSGILRGGTADTKVRVNSGDSHADLSAGWPLPKPGATPDLAALEAKLDFHIASIKDFVRESPVQGLLAGDGQINLSGGEPKGTIRFFGENLRYGDFTLQRVTMDASATDGTAKIDQLRADLDDSNYMDIGGSVKLAAGYPYQGTATLRLVDLSKLDGLLAKLNQAAGLRGTFELSATATGDAQQGLPHAEIRASGHDITYRGLPLQSLNLKADSNPEKITVETFQAEFDPQNSINLNGNLDLNPALHYEAIGEVHLANLEVFDSFLKTMGPDPNLTGNLEGRISGTGEIKNNRIANALINLTSTQLKYRGLNVQSTNVNGSVKDNFLRLPTMEIIVDHNNSIHLTGRAQLAEPYEYESDATVDLRDLRFLDPILKSFGQDVGLGGRLNLTWNGKGELKKSVGNAQLHILDLQVKGTKGIKADIEASYEGLKAEVSRLQVFSSLVNVDTTMRFSPKLFEIPHLEVRKDQNLLTGSVSVPLDLSQQKLPVAMDRPLLVDLVAEKVSLASFQTGERQMTGNAGLLLKASGTLRDPSIQIKTTLNDLRSPAVSSFAPANGEFNVQLANKVLTLDGHFQQPEIQPLQIQGKVPLDIAQVLDTGKLPSDTPIALSVRWPETNLQFARKLTPLIRVLEGRIAIDANVAGTLEKPQVSGALSANINRFHASTDVVPPIADFAVDINFRDNHRCSFDRCSGLAGGGPFSLSGTIDLAQGMNPQFDLTLTARKLLLTRSDNIIVRSNIDLTVHGPLSNLEVGGKVGLVDSRFFQDIDILPLNLPGRPAPQPPSVPPPSSVSVPTPPVRDWKFDIKVQTDGPFLVQSNLARGQITVDLQIGGTGLQPSVTGFVRVDQLTASLPFSHMDISNGYVDFSPGGNPLNPSFNINGVSMIRDYEVRMRVFGDVSNFQILFDSSPPLPQGDIATLLATGSTTTEFVQNPSLLAGRASFILAQQVLSKVFKIKPNAQQQSFLERLQVDIIPGDRPGTQDISARFSLANNWQLIGEFGQEGNVSGRLRYLIRFR
jgi:autotransporter translocation and assembly factor TamB